VLPIAEADMVHPSQVISQFSHLTHRKGYVPPAHNNLFFIPYFLQLAGDTDILESFTKALLASDPREIPFFGHRMDITRLTLGHLRWIIKQTIRLEIHIAGVVRPCVRNFLEAIRCCCTEASRVDLLDEVEAEVISNSTASRRAKCLGSDL
jgi:hypothetical protein